ncbi:putative ribonuclease H-like domain-containing protein [Tanacetum coccineum]
MNYIHVSVENQVNVDAGTQEYSVAGSSGKDKEPTQEYILYHHRPRIFVEDVVQVAQEKPFENVSKEKDVHDSEDVAENEEQHKLKEAEQSLKDDLERMVAQEMVAKAMDDATRQAFEEEKRNIASQKRAAQATSINKLNTGRPSVSTSNSPLVNTANTQYASAASTPPGANTGGSSFVYLGGQIPIDASTLPNADLPCDPNMPNLEDDSDVFPNDGIFSGAYNDEDVGALADFNNMDNTNDVSPIPTLRIHKHHLKDQTLGDPKSTIQTRGKIQQASSIQQALVIGTKWVFRNKRDERGIVVKSKARLVAQGFRQEEGIDYNEVFTPIARIQAIRLFLAFASFIGFPIYQMDVKSAFLYGTIREELYVHQPLGFVDPAHPNKVYKVVKALYGLHQAPRAWHETLSTFLLENGFRRVYVKKQPNEIFISQDKNVADILKKFDFCSIRTATTPIESHKPLIKDEDGVDVDVHVYRSMIGSLMYLTASRPDIMFAVCACARFQVTPKASHLHAVKRIFRNLKHQPKLGLWYPRDSPFELEAFSDSDYGGASLHRKSTTVKNPVYHSRTKHIEIRHHFIRDCYEKRLIDVLKIHTDNNVADLLTKGFDVTSSQIVNDVKKINATIDSKAVVVIEASIRSSLLFNDADGTACLTNEAIFQNLALMGYEGKPFNDVYATPAHTQKVFTNMSRKGLKFSGKITPLFPNMLTQAVVNVGEGLEQPTEPQPTPSPTQPSTIDQPLITASSSGPKHTHSHSLHLEGAGGIEGDQELFVLCTNLSNRVLTLETAKNAQAAEIIMLKKGIKKLKQKSKPVISHHRAWLRSMQKLSMKKRFGKKESVSKQGRKKAKPKSTLDDSTIFDDQDVDHGMDYMEAVDEGKKSDETEELI